MKKHILLNALIATALSAALLAGCGASGSANATTTAQETTNVGSEASTESAASETKASESAAAETSAAESKAASESTQAASEAETAPIGDTSEGAMKIGSLKGPTTMGLVNLMHDVESGSKSGYLFEMQTQPDVIMSELVSGKLDVALLPANVAAVAYNKTNKGVKVIDINTLGVLYCVTGDDSVKSVKDLSGKTVLSTGQGASPEYVLNYLLDKNGVKDCDVQFKSEATEIAATLKEDPTKIAILPQPFVTVAMAQNDALKLAFSLTDEWQAVSPDSKLLTGVTVVRNDYLADHKDQVDAFLADHKASTDKANADVSGTAALVAQYGIIVKAPIAEKALPQCNIVAITGDEMKTDLSGYLSVLNAANPKSVGGTLPDDDFYYVK
ncbi:ABC transporter substrate-binding protein [Oribacterium sp. HCP28S3_H8]|uniref:ABC transporter substrate-binding protein n=1 Tax=Oribacterium sp. HCP28S3_H8 TaxID=3438945 RepID=UPI003F8A2F75